MEEFSNGCSNLLVLQLFHSNRYLSEQKLPLEMLELQKRCTADGCNNVSGEDGGCSDSGNEEKLPRLRIWRSPTSYGKFSTVSRAIKVPLPFKQSSPD